MPKQNSAFELNELFSIQSSSAFRNLLIEHKETLQKQVNSLVREQRYTEAFSALGKFDDVDKIMLLISNRIKELQPKKEG